MATRKRLSCNFAGILRSNNKTVLELRVESQYNNAMACYACVSDGLLLYDYNLFHNRQILQESEAIDLSCIISEMIYRGLKL